MIQLKSGVQIPESAVVLNTVAALDSLYFSQPLRLVQYDQTTPIVSVTLTYKGTPYTPGEGAELRVRMGKPDGKGVYNPCLGVDESGLVYFVVTPQMTAAEGTGKVSIEMAENGGVKNSAPVPVHIDPNPVQEGQIESTDEYKTLDAILAEVQALEKTTVAAAASAAAAKTAAQAAREGAEQAEGRVQAIVAGNEAYTKQETHDRFALALQGTADPAASITIYPDAGSNVVVTAHGFTVQSGSGDPSPENVRPIASGGVKLVKLTITGATPGLGVRSTHPSGGISGYVSGAGGLYGGVVYAETLPTGTDEDYNSNTKNAYVFITSGGAIGFALPYSGADKTLSAMRSVLNDEPLTVYFQPADEHQATGLYIPLTGTGDGHTGVCAKIKDKLCPGDTFVTKVKSGTDERITFDGSLDEDWQLSGSPVSGYVKAYIAVPKVTIDTAMSNWLKKGIFLADWLSNVSREYITSSEENICVQIKTDGGHTLENLRSILAENPLEARYRSTDYTESKDKPAAMEIHAASFAELDGDTVDLKFTIANNQLENTTEFRIGNGVSVSANGILACTNLKPYNVTWNVDTPYICGYGGSSSFKVSIRLPNSVATTVEAANQWLKDQKAAGTPVQMVVKLAAQTVYAHDPVDFIANPGEDGSWVITGEANGKVSAVYNKNLTHTIAELQAALLAMGAQLSM